MGKCLTKREFEYKSGLFAALGINKKDVVGKNFEQLSELIKEKTKNYEESSNIGEGLYNYILPLYKGQKISIIAFESKKLFFTLKSKRKFSSRDKACLSYYALSSLSAFLLILIPQCYLISRIVVKCYQNIPFNLRNALYYGALTCIVTGLISCITLICFIIKSAFNFKIEDSKKHPKEECLFDEFENELSKKREYKTLILLTRYLPIMGIILEVTNFILQLALNGINLKNVDTKLLTELLIVESLLILSFGLQCLANEVYERKVVNLVKEERAEGKLDDVNINFSNVPNQGLSQGN